MRESYLKIYINFTKLELLLACDTVKSNAALIMWIFECHLNSFLLIEIRQI